MQTTDPHDDDQLLIVALILKDHLMPVESPQLPPD